MAPAVGVEAGTYRHVRDHIPRPDPRAADHGRQRITEGAARRPVMERVRRSDRGTTAVGRGPRCSSAKSRSGSAAPYSRTRNGLEFQPIRNAPTTRRNGSRIDADHRDRLKRPASVISVALEGGYARQRLRAALAPYQTIARWVRLHQAALPGRSGGRDRTRSRTCSAHPRGRGCRSAADRRRAADTGRTARRGSRRTAAPPPRDRGRRCRTHSSAASRCRSGRSRSVASDAFGRSWAEHAKHDPCSQWDRWAMPCGSA